MPPPLVIESRVTVACSRGTTSNENGGLSVVGLGTKNAPVYMLAT